MGEADLLDFRWSILEVEHQGVRFEPVQGQVRESSPGNFTQNSSSSGLGAVLNPGWLGERSAKPSRVGASHCPVRYSRESHRNRRESTALSVTVTMGALTRAEAGVGVDVLHAGAVPGLVLGVPNVVPVLVSLERPATATKPKFMIFN